MEASSVAGGDGRTLSSAPMASEAKRVYTVISCDGHLEIPPDAWLRHVPPSTGIGRRA